MKSLKQLAIENGAVKYSQSASEESYQKIIINFEQLESLINEVISQRLGEPVGYIVQTEFTALIEGDGLALINRNQHETAFGTDGTPLYALNIES